MVEVVGLKLAKTTSHRTSLALYRVAVLPNGGPSREPTWRSIRILSSQDVVL